MSTGKGTSPVVLFLAAWGVNLAFDGLALLSPALSPPHLLHRFMPEMIRGMVSPAVLAPMASVVLAAIDLLLLSVVPPEAPRRLPQLVGWLLGFWLLSEGLLAWVWLEAPGGAILAALATGIPRSLAAAWLLLRLEGPAAGPEAR
jgi:hypothetical protein